MGKSHGLANLLSEVNAAQNTSNPNQISANDITKNIFDQGEITILDQNSIEVNFLEELQPKSK